MTVCLYDKNVTCNSTCGNCPAVQALAGPGAGPLTVAVGCAGGRHRAAMVGMALPRTLTTLLGIPAILTHRDLDKDVVTR